MVVVILMAIEPPLLESLVSSIIKLPERDAWGQCILAGEKDTHGLFDVSDVFKYVHSWSLF